MSQPIVDIGILTIRDDEFRAVLSAFVDGHGIYRGRHREYTLRTADAGQGELYRLAILHQIEQGNGEAQEAARDLMDDLEPSLLLVVGIAGGLPSDDISLGDVVLSTRVHDFSVEARQFQDDATYNVGGGPIAKSIARGIANLAAREPELGEWWTGLPSKPAVPVTGEKLIGPKAWKEKVRQKLQVHYGAGVAERPPGFIAGAIASSDRLVKDPELVLPWITSARGILAIEMESAGVHRAARDRTPMLSIRGLSDIVGYKRDDAWTKYACASAAGFTRAYLRTRPVPLRESTKPYLDAQSGVQHLIINSTREIEEKTRDFVGRKFVFDAFRDFLCSEQSGYFFLFGERGIGKTSVAARLVRDNGYVHHFNQASSGINSPARFAENVCAQLIVRYGLRRESVPAEFRDNVYLMSLLEEVSGKTETANIIVIDAIDEVTHERSAETNLLFLPKSPPAKTYFFVTSSEEIHLRMDSEPGRMTIKADSDENQEDIRDYLKKFISNREISTALGLTSTSAKRKFVSALAAKSAGNFMYLHYVLPELLRSHDKEAKLRELPEGLKNYYNDHWERMRKKSEHWADRALPIIAVLTASRSPLDLKTIFKYSGLEKRAHVRQVLTALPSFIPPRRDAGTGTELFQIYHQSFVDFLETKPEIRDELEGVRDQMVDRMSDFLK
jgi:nucleoside phosphorylase